MPKVQANGIDLYYELMGKGEPLALIGGSLFGRQNFGMVWEGLAKHFQLISYDQRGYGLSDRPLQAYDLDLWADDLAALLDALKIDRCHVMGTSAGGMIALKFAAKYPDRCIGVVSDCAFAKCDTMRKIMFRTWRHMATSWGCSPEFADHVITQAVGAEFLDGPQGKKVVEMVRTVVGMNSPETVVQACLAMEKMDLRKDIKKIKNPTMVITARKDMLTPMTTGKTGAGAQWVADNLKGCELKVYDNIGHADLVECPDETIAATVKFLKRAKKKMAKK
ncbi:MAG: alpha/beta hydrolase [Alphaproteobacteria bacterium]|jgi:pimeloyl-ACP methyl ester carboxylesterase|nr:alpha/beta hydrolase [Alphaproteobacteria bacterium]